MIAVVLPLQKENESESGDAPGEQADPAPCMHGDDECTTAEEERSREAAQDENNGSEGESSCSAEQVGTLTVNEVEEESSTQPPPSHQPENTEPENVEKDGHSNNCVGTAVNDMEESSLPAEVKANPSNDCEEDFPLIGPPGGDFPPTGPQGGDSPTASAHQEDVQVNRRRSIVVPLEGSANESFEVILCGGEMDAPIAVMEAPVKPASGRKGKRKSKGDEETNVDGSLPSESCAVLKPPVKGVQQRESEEQVGVNGDESQPAKSTVVLKPPVKDVGKKRKRKLLRCRDVKNSKRKQSSATGKPTQEPQVGSTSSEGMHAYVVQPVFAVPPCQSLPFCAPSQEAIGTSQSPNSNFQNPPPIPVFTTKKRKSKLVPSKQAKSCRAAADPSRLAKMGSVVSADLNEVEVFSVAAHPVSTTSSLVKQAHAKGRKTKHIRQRT